jgi:hypothetical protein
MTANLNPSNEPPKTSEHEQYILNYSFDRVYKLLMTGQLAYNPITQAYDRVQVGADGGLKMAATDSTARYDLQAPVYYLGSAPVGTAEGTASWSITKVDTTTNPITAKVAQNEAWSNRAGATYV